MRINVKYLLALSLFFIVVEWSYTHAQLTEPGKPLLKLKSAKAKIPFAVMPGFDPDTLNQKKKQGKRCKLKPFRFAHDFDVDLTSSNAGIWDTLENGTAVWHLGIASEGAYSINVIFDPFYLPRGCKVFIYSIDSSSVIGALTSKNNKSSGVLPVSPVAGDSIIIELQVSPSVNEQHRLRIKKVNHDYKNVFGYLRLKDGNYNNSGDCNIDIACPLGDGWGKESSAVCRLLINGIELCSGSLINNTSYDGTPYVLTANHCIDTENKANETIFYFNYKSPSCDGPDGEVKDNISSSELIATTSHLDFCLVELSKKPPFSFSPYYAGWNADGTKPSNTVTIHHPMGDVKKISTDNDAPITANFGSGYDFQSHWKVIEWDYGVTEGGSSGAPLFNADHRIIGDLTGGDAACGNPVNDYYAKLSRSWDDYADKYSQLKYWLDPKGIGSLSIGGYDPYEDVKAGCDTISNVLPDEEEVVYTFSDPGWGAWSGQNSEGYKVFAERFVVEIPRDLAGVYIHFKKAYNGLSFSNITLKVWDGNEYPDSLINEKDILINDISENQWNHFSFDSAVRVSDTFFVGYEIYYRVFLDTISVYQAKNRDVGQTKTAYIKNDGQWYTFDSLIAGDFSTSYAIRVVSCLDIPDDISKKETTTESNDAIIVYPNPARDHIYICNNSNMPVEFLQFRLFNFSGMLVIEKNINANGPVKINLGNIPPGVYVARIITGKNLITKKILVL